MLEIFSFIPQRALCAADMGGPSASGIVPVTTQKRVEQPELAGMPAKADTRQFLVRATFYGWSYVDQVSFSGQCNAKALKILLGAKGPEQEVAAFLASGKDEFRWSCESRGGRSSMRIDVVK